jgi:diacylglycerol kinase family enzyme
MPRVEAIAALPSLFRGTHINRDDVHEHRARHIRVQALRPPLGMDLDGEPATGNEIEFEILPGALRLLSGPIE